MSKPKFMCLDVETTGLDWTMDKLHGIGVGYEEDECAYYPVWGVPDSVRRDLANPKISKLGHNLHAFDAKFIKRAGFDIQGAYDDTMILANLVDNNLPLGLKFLADRFLGAPSLDNKRNLDQYIQANGGGNIAALCARDLIDPGHPHTEIIGEYCKEDVNNTIKLFWLFIKKLRDLDACFKGQPFFFKKSPLDYYREEARPLERVLFEIEYHGIRVDISALAGIRDSSLARMADIERKLLAGFGYRIGLAETQLYVTAYTKAITEKAKAKLVKGAGKLKFSFTNNNHFGVLLYQHCGLPEELVYVTEKGKFKTDKETLVNLVMNLRELGNHPLIPLLDLFAEYKLHAKIASTYTGDANRGVMSKVRVVNGQHRIFPVYQQTTATGRLKCSNPNMQNLKRDSEVKKLFIPDNQNEVFDDIDYSQIELRTGAHLSKDNTLVAAYLGGEDVHLLTASRLFKKTVTKADDIERQAGKRTNFLTIFRGKAPRLVAELKKDTGKDFTVAECEEFIRIWFELYPGVQEYLDNQLAFFKKYHFCITETGRVRKLPDIRYGEFIKWNRHPYQNRYTPSFVGPETMRQDIVDYLKKKRKRTSEEAIGWEARRRYEHAVKAGYNEPIQGLAASMVKRAMIALHAAGKQIANQVHDSLTVTRDYADKSTKDFVINTMRTVYPLSIPVEVDVKTLKSFHPKDKA